MKPALLPFSQPRLSALLRRTVLLALVPLCAAPMALAQNTGGTSTTGGSSTEIVQLSKEAFDALAAWDGRVASFESVALERHEDAVRGYAYALTSGLRKPLGEHIRETLPASHAAFLEETGQDPAEDDTAMLAFLMGVRQDDYSRLQQQAEILSLGLTFAEWVPRNSPLLEAEVIDLQSRTPAALGISVEGYLIDSGLASVYGEMNDIGYAPSTADCSCWLVVEDFERTSGEDDQFISDSSESGFANIVKRWWTHDPLLDGASKIDYNYRQSKFGKNFEKTYEVESSSSIRMKLHCTQGNSFMGAACPQSNACTGKAWAKADYGSRIWVRARGAGAKVVGNKAYTAASDAVSVNLRIDGDLAGSSRDKATGIDMRILNQRATAGQIFTEVISPIIKFLVSWGQSGGAFEDALVDWLVSGDAFGGAKFLIYGEDDEGYQIKEEHDKELEMILYGGGTFSLKPGEEYAVNVDTHSMFRGSGWGANSISESTVDSAYYLAVAHGDYSCNATTTPPAEGGAFMWGAMENAPAAYTSDYLKNGIAGFLSSKLDPNYQGSTFAAQDGSVTVQ